MMLWVQLKVEPEYIGPDTLSDPPPWVHIKSEPKFIGSSSMLDPWFFRFNSRLNPSILGLTLC